MHKSNYEFAHFSWSPITGCKRKCIFCPVAPNVFRTAGDVRRNMADPRCVKDFQRQVIRIDEQFMCGKRAVATPFGMYPTLHSYRLDVPGKIKVGRRWLVGHMGDMFGNWIPTQWIEDVFDSCIRYSHHKYLFRTKNPQRYEDLESAGKLPSGNNFWWGTFITSPEEYVFKSDFVKTWLYVEPIEESFQSPEGRAMLKASDWIVIGCDTKSHSTVEDQRRWAKEIMEIAEEYKIPVFARNNLGLGASQRQEFPAELEDFKGNVTEEYKSKHWDKCSLCGKESPTKDMFAVMIRIGRETPRRLYYVHENCLLKDAERKGLTDALNQIIAEGGKDSGVGRMGKLRKRKESSESGDR